MKYIYYKIVFVFLMMILGTCVAEAAMSLNDIVKPGTIWVGNEADIPEENRTANGWNKYRNILKIEGSTIVKDVEYLRLISITCEYKDEFDLRLVDVRRTGDLVALIRVEGSKIVVLNMNRYSFDDPDELIYYDFGLKDNEIGYVNLNFYYKFPYLQCPADNSSWKFTEKEVVCLHRTQFESCGNTYTALLMSHTDIVGLAICSFWIEGIGAMNMIWQGTENVEAFGPKSYNQIVKNQQYLDYVVVDGQVVYKSSDFDYMKAVDEVTSGIQELNTTSDTRLNNNPIYDINGRVIKNNTSPISIMGGKKYYSKP